jgi:hypothetical protein
MTYSIHRECWNEHTFNGYTDNPYWRVSFKGCDYGLTDDGQLWSINNSYINESVKVDLESIIKECKLNIQLK